MALQHGPQAMGGVQGSIAALNSATRYNEMMQRAKMQSQAQVFSTLQNIGNNAMRSGMQAKELNARADLMREGWGRQDEQATTAFNRKRDYALEMNDLDRGNQFFEMKLGALQKEEHAKADLRIAQTIGPQMAKATNKSDAIKYAQRLKQEQEFAGIQQRKAQEAKVIKQAKEIDDQRWSQASKMTTDPETPNEFRAGLRDVTNKRAALITSFANGTSVRPKEFEVEMGKLAAKRDLYLSHMPPKVDPTPAQMFNKIKIDGKDVGFPGTVWQPNKDKTGIEQVIPVDRKQPDPSKVPGKQPFGMLAPDVRAKVESGYNSLVKAESPAVGTVEYDIDGNKIFKVTKGMVDYAADTGYSRKPMRVRNIVTNLGQGTDPKEISNWLVEEGHPPEQVHAAMNQALQIHRKAQYSQQAIGRHQGMMGQQGAGGVPPQQPMPSGPPQAQGRTNWRASMPMGPGMSPPSPREAPAAQPSANKAQVEQELMKLIQTYGNADRMPPDAVARYRQLLSARGQ